MIVVQSRRETFVATDISGFVTLHKIMYNLICNCADDRINLGSCKPQIIMIEQYALVERSSGTRSLK